MGKAMKTAPPAGTSSLPDVLSAFPIHHRKTTKNLSKLPEGPDAALMMWTFFSYHRRASLTRLPPG